MTEPTAAERERAHRYHRKLERHYASLAIQAFSDDELAAEFAAIRAEANERAARARLEEAEWWDANTGADAGTFRRGRRIAQLRAEVEGKK